MSDSCLGLFDLAKELVFMCLCYVTSRRRAGKHALSKGCDPFMEQERGFSGTVALHVVIRLEPRPYSFICVFLEDCSMGAALVPRKLNIHTEMLFVRLAPINPDFKDHLKGMRRRNA